jgi:hypothetical protein
MHDLLIGGIARKSLPRPSFIMYVFITAFHGRFCGIEILKPEL